MAIRTSWKVKIVGRLNQITMTKTVTSWTGFNICVCAKVWPDVGGIETLTESLATEWTRQGHKVTVVTDVELNEGQEKNWPFKILRNPRPDQATKIRSESSLILHMNLSLKALRLLRFSRNRLFVSHQSWYRTPSGKVDLREFLKRLIIRGCAYSISCSEAVQRSLHCGGEVIPNPFDQNHFRLGRTDRIRDIVFVGRLVSDKGIDVLLRAVHTLRSQNITPTVTIVGDGPERNVLTELAAQLELSNQVKFVGKRDHTELPLILNEHTILAVPSRWNEPFGIVALEGAACGCVVIGSNGGGLPEAIGPAGFTFPNGDYYALAMLLKQVLEKSISPDHAKVAEHLAKHTVTRVATHYTEHFESRMRVGT